MRHVHLLLMSYQTGHDGTSITSIKASNLPYMQDYREHSIWTEVIYQRLNDIWWCIKKKNDLWEQIWWHASTLPLEYSIVIFGSIFSLSMYLPYFVDCNQISRICYLVCVHSTYHIFPTKSGHLYIVKTLKTIRRRRPPRPNHSKICLFFFFFFCYTFFHLHLITIF